MTYGEQLREIAKGENSTEKKLEALKARAMEVAKQGGYSMEVSHDVYYNSALCESLNKDGIEVIATYTALMPGVSSVVQKVVIKW